MTPPFSFQSGNPLQGTQKSPKQTLSGFPTKIPFSMESHRQKKNPNKRLYYEQERPDKPRHLISINAEKTRNSQ